MGPDQPPLPRPPGDPEKMRQLLDDARRKMEEEEYMRTMPRPVYGGPPVTRRWTMRGIVMLIAGALAAIAAAVFGMWKMAAPVYGGPPAPVYGGPVVPPERPPQKPDEPPVVPPK